jgi:SAM-dependent methyltransferase
MSTTDATRAEAIAAVGYDYAAQPKRRLTECNLCESRRLTTVTHVDRYGFEASASLCERCGLIFLNPVMSAEAYTEFYVSVYRPLVSAYHGRLIAADTIQGEQRAYAEEVARFVDAWRGERAPKRILDVGGSTGVVAARLVESLGASALVVDPAPLEVDEAKRLGRETFTGFMEDFEAAPGSFDFGLVCQTIDHLLDVRGTLAKIHRLLDPNGLLFVDIVDVRSTWLRAGRLQAAIKIDHPYDFVEESAEYGLARCGFEVIAKEYAADRLHIRYLCAPVEPRPELEPDARAVAELVREVRRLVVLDPGA